MVKKLALLVGCNYFNNNDVPKLHGCINDVKAMHGLIRQRFGFKNENITILTDEKENKKKPTRQVIVAELANLKAAAKPGDILLFYFSGGGARVSPPDKNGTISVIVPSDLKPITGKKILDIIKQFPATVICDSSYSGGLFQKIDAPIEANVAENKPNFGSKTIPPNLLQPIDVSEYPPNNCNTFSSSMSNEKSVEVYLNGDTSKAFSAYSSAIQALFNSPGAKIPSPVKKNSDVEAFTKELLKILQFAQHPRSTANNAAALFLGGYAT